MFPYWFDLLSIAYICFGFVCAIVLLVDIVRSPQQMRIMNVVWPVTALFGTALVVAGYFRFGRRSNRRGTLESPGRSKETTNEDGTPFYAMVGKGALHCGSGCMIGDICAEWLAFLAPSIAILFGWHTLFSQKMFAVWVIDFVFAFALGIIFQYFAIVPMRNLSATEGLKAAVKADALSLIAWQVGMYGAMAILQLFAFPLAFGTRADVNSWEFWFAMQIAMVCGFATSYPVNWYLLASGIKEKM